VLNEVKALYEITGEKGELFNLPEKKIKLDDGSVKQLSNKEYSEYSKRLGERTYNGYQKMINTNAYANADDETRLKLLGDIKQNAKAIVQDEMFGKRNKHTAESKMQQKIDNKLNKGQRKIDLAKNKVYKQLVEQIMYEE
jgi:predicted S18 family serine protease